MQYQALYRKHRPQRFDEVVGQPHVTETLRREIVEDKIAHAYLFTGPRGTGKTTTARILAKALNCADLAADGEPCNECPSCVAITEGSSLDVVELDAASHNKVEDIREIRVNVGTVAASTGSKRIYILDEAHMLSRAAGNALLKTLEEPPEHVVFVLATTEPYKLLDTIRSRAQRFDFHPVASEILVEHLGRIAAAEGFTVDQGGLNAVVTHAGGSVRDAMSLLEQVAALGEGSVTAEGVGRALGLAEPETFEAVAGAIAEQNAAAALEIVARLAARGADLRRFVADAIAFFRGVFLAHYAPHLEEIVDAPVETMERWRREAGRLQAADVLRAIDTLGDALADLRRGREERLVVELAMLRLVRPELEVDAAAVASRVDRLERRVGELERRPAAVVSTPPDSQPAPASLDAPFTTETAPEAVTASGPTAPPPSPAPAPAEGLTLEAFEAIWPAVVGRVRSEIGPRRHAFVKEATPVEVTGSTVVFEVPAHLHFHLEQLRADEELQARMVEIAAELLGGTIEVAFRPGTDEEPSRAETTPRVPDPETLVAADDGAERPEDLVADILGAEVVSDPPGPAS